MTKTQKPRRGFVETLTKKHNNEEEIASVHSIAQVANQQGGGGPKNEKQCRHIAPQIPARGNFAVI